MKAPAGRGHSGSGPSGRGHINCSFTVIVGAAITNVVIDLLR